MKLILKCKWIISWTLNSFQEWSISETEGKGRKMGLKGPINRYEPRATYSSFCANKPRRGHGVWGWRGWCVRAAAWPPSLFLLSLLLITPYTKASSSGDFMWSHTWMCREWESRRGPTSSFQTSVTFSLLVSSSSSSFCQFKASICAPLIEYLSGICKYLCEFASVLLWVCAACLCVCVRECVCVLLLHLDSGKQDDQSLSPAVKPSQPLSFNQ